MVANHVSFGGGKRPGCGQLYDYQWLSAGQIPLWIDLAEGRKKAGKSVPYDMPVVANADEATDGDVSAGMGVSVLRRR